ncbi:MAG: N(4)-(beta-N-acetylglucosaminyl)-L-asparaginase [Vicinamibacterales bacterium]|jgi:N4-(beta-N-acetylglucosaminyl)-L-asparaginase|nr:N(4)-(beta-N-acetylglucosaminyl)-L-asparaginase [Vicinamibacterales bacterium]MDP7672216.1 N(4)-(beta-N-acetylglucosaminyl)-L-asparaginase [Vicinamibacterales bacterium]HJO37637.1 N(4)-(beta-N-acetylglucosaminyl)-L-asparaginase [Vicinamibacterales bacterium]
MRPAHLSRRGFLSGFVGTGLAVPGAARAASTTLQDRSDRPLVVTSKTNNAVREEITTTAWDIMRAGGNAMDAAERATNVSERDPRDATVGYGGDPNEDGFHQLDAAVMNGADNNNIGAVAALENIKTPSSVARLVMDRTDHWMLAGRGALRFAKMHGFEEEDLLTDAARQHWVDWKENLSNRDYYFPPSAPSEPPGGTINVLTLDANGDIAGVTSTIGHHFKLVGRVGDSPIIGAGLYVDNEVGAAGATGHGEECVKNSGSFHVVELMRQGLSPQDACESVCQRVMDRHNGKPMFNLKFVALDKQGRYGCGALRRTGFAVHDARGHRVEDGRALLPRLTQAEIDSLPWR